MKKKGFEISPERAKVITEVRENFLENSDMIKPSIDVCANGVIGLINEIRTVMLFRNVKDACKFWNGFSSKELPDLEGVLEKKRECDVETLVCIYPEYAKIVVCDHLDYPEFFYYTLQKYNNLYMPLIVEYSDKAYLISAYQDGELPKSGKKTYFSEFVEIE